MNEPKEAWSRPELVVIVRGRPEEAVLEGCKDLTKSGTATLDSFCSNGPPACNSECMNSSSS